MIVDERLAEDGSREWLVKFSGYSGFFWANKVSSGLRMDWEARQKPRVISSIQKVAKSVDDWLRTGVSIRELVVAESPFSEESVMITDVVRFHLRALVGEVQRLLRASFRLSKSNAECRVMRKLVKIPCMPQVSLQPCMSCVLINLSGIRFHVP